MSAAYRAPPMCPFPPHNSSPHRLTRGARSASGPSAGAEPGLTSIDIESGPMVLLQPLGVGGPHRLMTSNAQMSPGTEARVW